MPKQMLTCKEAASQMHTRRSHELSLALGRGDEHEMIHKPSLFEILIAELEFRGVARSLEMCMRRGKMRGSSASG